MKLSACISMIPVLTYLATMGSAYPVNGYQLSSLEARELSDMDNDFTLRSVDELDIRGLTDIIHKVTGKKELTEEQKQAKIRKLQQKLYKDIGKHHEKVAKIENGPGNHAVNINKYQGSEDHRKMAEKKTQQEWKTTKNLQQFRHADVSVKEEPGKKHIITRYHNGPGNGFGSTAHFFVHDH
ncbi:hypothetical protein BDZ97DRAFT_93445 [Flammula alnicola]|nr:hypothetical protein BDZ97DRAFT_93445 [Flammula alnicola]